MKKADDMKIDSNKNEVETSVKLFQLLLRIPVPWVFVLAYLFGVGLQFLFQSNQVSDEARRLSLICGIILFAVGGVFAGWSLFIFHKAHTTTTPGEKSSSLITRGPYKFGRNPMYVSLTLAYLGEAGMLAQIWPLFILPFCLAYINWIVIPLEEARLKEVFAQKYEEYCSKVRRWL